MWQKYDIKYYKAPIQGYSKRPFGCTWLHKKVNKKNKADFIIIIGFPSFIWVAFQNSNIFYLIYSTHTSSNYYFYMPESRLIQ